MTQNHTLIRKPSVTGGDTDALNDYLVVDQWDRPLVQRFVELHLDTVFLNLGSHTCECKTTDVQEQPASMDVKRVPNPASGDVVVGAAVIIREVVLHNLAGQQAVKP